LKKLLKYFKRIILTLLSLILIYFLAALVLSIISTRPVEHSCDHKESIYLSTNGIHLDIILQREDLDADLIRKLGGIDDAKYIAFGWGDEDFYLNTPTWEDLTAKTLLKAMFYKSNSVMHVTKYYRKRSGFIALKICKSQQQALMNFIQASFEKNNENHFIKIENAGYSKQDNFYKAIGSYTCFNTCNEWVNKGLKKAAIKTSIWSPFDTGILYHIEKNQTQ